MDYLAPITIEEAVGALASTSDSRVFAGATDLIPQIRSGRPEPGLLVDLKRIDRLTAVTEGDTSWTIGAAAPTSGLTENIAFSPQQLILGGFARLGNEQKDHPQLLLHRRHIFQHDS